MLISGFPILEHLSELFRKMTRLLQAVTSGCLSLPGALCWSKRLLGCVSRWPSVKTR